MAKRRARINEDNDPLNPTDRVLAGLEQAGKPKSQEANKSTSQKVEKLDPPYEEQVRKSRSQESSQSKQDNEQADQLTSQQVRKSEPRKPNQSTTQPANKLTSQEDNQSASYTVDKPKLRKSTFQINEAVLEQLDKLHLQLQLDIGKGNAPYKEVIVEEAIVRLLQLAQTEGEELVELLQQRQKSRETLKNRR